MRESSFFTHTSKMITVIQAFLLDLYGNGSFLMLLKHLKFADLSITRGGKFSPTMLAVTKKVSLSLVSLPSAHLSILKT